jgi:hypothetical protein
MSNPHLDLVEHHEASVKVSTGGWITVSVDAEFGLPPEVPIFIEAQLISLKDDTVLSSSVSYYAEISLSNPRIFLSDEFQGGEDCTPNNYKISFRLFTVENPVEIDAPIPPEIAREAGAFLIHAPKKGFLSSEKWNSGTVSVESVVIKNVAGEDDQIFVNLTSKKPLSAGYIIDCVSGDKADKSDFRIVEKPQQSSQSLSVHLRDNLIVTLTSYSASDWHITDRTDFTEPTDVPDGQDARARDERLESPRDINDDSRIAATYPKVATQPDPVKRSSASPTEGDWLWAPMGGAHQFTEETLMSITRFECEEPDEDGDISIDIEFDIKNESDKDISLIKYDLVLEQDARGAVGGQIRNTEDCLLDPGETFSGSSWLRVNRSSLDEGSSEFTVKLYARVYEREFFKLGAIDIPPESNSTARLQKKIGSELLDSSITISMMRRPEDGDEGSKEDRLEFVAGIRNKSDLYLEDVELRIALIDRTGEEDEDTYDSLDVLAPRTGIYLEPSFWGKPKSKLKGASAELSLKAYRLIGTQVISETKTITI